jgi:hypothetical protein
VNGGDGSAVMREKQARAAVGKGPGFYARGGGLGAEVVIIILKEYLNKRTLT